MAEPTRKSQGIKDFLDENFDRTNTIRADKCVSCRKDATKFRDALSAREYRISGLCQECQDLFFGR